MGINDKLYKVNLEDHISDIEMEDVFTWDYPDFCDAYISIAYNKLEGRWCNDEELEYLNEMGYASEHALEYIIS